MKKYGFSVDIGGTSCKMGLFYMTGQLIEKWEIPTDTKENGRFILANITKSIEETLEKKSIQKDEVQGIGVGVPGPVGGDGKVYKCVNLGWDVFNIENELSEMTGLRVRAGNDANVAALGEMWQGGGQGYRNLVMITLGTGVGGGVVQEGKIVFGVKGAGGEIGHLKMKEDERGVCGCGKQGCLEQYASATGIVNAALKKISNCDKETELRKEKVMTAKAIFDAAKTGDEVASELVDELCMTLGTALANIASILNPDIFVIGGGVSRAGDILITGIEKYFNEKTFHACEGTKIVLAKLGNDAGMYGCLKLLF